MHQHEPIIARYGDRELAVIPVVHARVSSAQAALLACERYDPEVLAVELPASIRDKTIEGLGLPVSKSVAVTRRLEFNLRRLPLDRISDWHNTRTFNAAAQRVIAYANKCAGAALPDVPWETTHALDGVIRGFDPVVIFYRACRSGDFRRDKIAVPDRTHVHNYGIHAGEFHYDSGRTLRAVDDTAARVFFAPPVDPHLWAERCLLMAQKDGPEAPEALERKTSFSTLAPLEPLERAIASARHRVVCLCPRDLDIPDELYRRVTLIRVDLEEALADPQRAADLELVRRDECETGMPKSETNQAEIYNLNGGDAIMEATRWAISRKIPIKFIDREICSQAELDTCFNRPGMPYAGDSTIIDEGIQAFYQRIREAAERTRIEPLDFERERSMAARLRQLMASAHRVLFVCGAAHWSTIDRLLKSPLGVAEPQTEPPLDPRLRTDVELICSGQWSLRPAYADVNFIVTQFHKARLRNRLASFNLESAWRQMRARVALQLAPLDMSVTDAIAFERLLQRWCLREGIATPTIGHITRVAQACLPPKAVAVIEQIANRPRQGCPDGMRRISGVTMNGHPVVSIGDERMKLASKSGPLVLAHGGASLHHGPGRGHVPPRHLSDPNYASDKWCHSMTELMVKARSLAGIRDEVFRPSCAAGRLRGRPAVRAMIRSRAQGRKRTYVLEPLQERVVVSHPFERFDPVVWDFGLDDSRYEFMPYYLDGAYHMIGSVAYRTRLANDAVVFGALAAFMPLFDLESTARVGRWIHHGNRKFIPDTDSVATLSTPTVATRQAYIDDLVKLTLRFSRNHVILVSSNSPSDATRSAARALRRRVHYVPISRFRSAEIRSIRMCEFVPHTEDTLKVLYAN